MNGAIRIGGPLAIRCPTCRRAPGEECHTLDGADGRPVPWPRKRPHAARVKAAPPEQEAREGNLVVVRFAGGERLAVLVSVEPARIRIWRRDLDRFERDAVHVSSGAVLRLAPDDETTAAARAALAGEQTS